jgi:hypothetical protein
VTTAIAIKTRLEIAKDKIELQNPEWCPNYQQPAKGHRGYFELPNYFRNDIDDAANLLEHPYLRNRFFVTPPVNEVCVSCGKTEEYSTVLNANGVTICDAYIAITEQ